MLDPVFGGFGRRISEERYALPCLAQKSMQVA